MLKNYVLRRAVPYVFLILASLYTLWPLSIMIEEGFGVDLSGFFSGRGIRFVGGVPFYSGGFHPTLLNYLASLMAGNFPRLVLNSSVIAFLSLALAMATGIPTGYALARFRFRGKSFVALLILALRTVSPFAIVVPLYLLYVHNGLWDTYLGMGLAYLSITIPVVVWMLRGLFADVSKEVYEAAELSGASEQQIFTHIALPMVLPGLAATAIFAFILVWNEFLLANLLTGPLVKTVSVGIWTGAGEQIGTLRVVNWDELNAVGALAFFPAITILLLIRKYLARAVSLATTK